MIIDYCTHDIVRTVILIPIKLNSRRIPGKNIKKFSDGTPLMMMIQKACLGVKGVDEIYVYCSNPSIKEYIIDGVKFLQRPSYLDEDESNCNDIIREFMKVVSADIYVVSCATSPFTKSSSIQHCIEAVSSGQYDSAFITKKVQSFLWKNNSALNFNPDHLPRTQDLEPIHEESSGAFVFTRETFEKYGRRVGINPLCYDVDIIESIDIDNPLDFQLADAVFKEIYHYNHPN